MLMLVSMTLTQDHSGSADKTILSYGIQTVYDGRLMHDMFVPMTSTLILKTFVRLVLPVLFCFVTDKWILQTNSNSKYNRMVRIDAVHAMEERKKKTKVVFYHYVSKFLFDLSSNFKNVVCGVCVCVCVCVRVWLIGWHWLLLLSFLT